MSHPYPIGARIQYDPSGNRDPNGRPAGVTKVTETEPGVYVYSIVLRDPQTNRPLLPALNDVAMTSVYRSEPTAGPGNDL